MHKLAVTLLTNKELGSFIGASLTFRRSVLMPLDMDEGTTHYDLLFTIPELQLNNGSDVKVGLKMHYMFVSIMSHWAFAFELEKGKIFFADYLAEKLNVTDVIAERLREIFQAINDSFDPVTRKLIADGTPEDIAMKTYSLFSQDRNK